MVKKKSFKNPAMQFISTESIEQAGGQEVAQSVPSAPSVSLKGKTTPPPPEGYKVNPEYIEKKSRRVQILMQPSIYEAVKEKALDLGISTNEAINEALRQYVEG